MSLSKSEWQISLTTVAFITQLIAVLPGNIGEWENKVLKNQWKRYRKKGIQKYLAFINLAVVNVLY